MTLSLLSDWPDNSFSKAAPDTDLVAEQSRHNAARNAGRHPDQPSYPGPCALPPKEEPKNVYQLAFELVKECPQWCECRDVGPAGEGKVTISPYNGRLIMTYYRSINLPVINVDVAILSPESGWLWTLEPEIYERWKAQCIAGKPDRQALYAGGRGLLPDNPRYRKQWR